MGQRGKLELNPAGWDFPVGCGWEVEICPPAETPGRNPVTDSQYFSVGGQGRVEVDFELFRPNSLGIFQGFLRDVVLTRDKEPGNLRFIYF